MSDNKRISYNILIGKNKYGEYVFLDESFKHSDGFMGLVGTAMQFHTEEEFEEAKDNYLESGDLLYLRQEAVKNGQTEESYRDWLEEVLEEDTDLVYDSSYRCKWRIDEALEIIDKHEYDETGIHATSEFSDCCGGGRMFESKMLKEDYREWVEEENFEKFKKLYVEFEKPNDDRVMIDRAKSRLKELYAVGLFETDTAKESREHICNDVEYAEKFLKQFGAIEHDKNLSFND